MMNIIPIHILIVEDNEGDIFLFTESLEEKKILSKISIARDGSEAIDFLDRKGKYKDEMVPDLILLDINLPKKNGHEVLEYIKVSDLLKNIPVFMVTTSSAQNDIVRANNNGADCFITKPVDVENLVSIIHKLDNFWLNIVKIPNLIDR